MGFSKQLFVRKQWFLLQTTHIALELAFTSTTAATDKPQCVRRLEFNASLPPSSISRKQKNKEIKSSKRAGKDHKRSRGLTRHRHGTCDWWAHLPADSESTQQMLPPASCRAPSAAAAAVATPESLPDLHQILLLLADRSHSPLLSPCEISGTEYCPSSSSVPCVRQESFTPGGYVCIFLFRRAGGLNFAKFSIWKKWKKNTDKFIYFSYRNFGDFFLSSKISRIYTRKSKFCKIYFPNFFVEKWRNLARKKKHWRISVYLYPSEMFSVGEFSPFRGLFLIRNNLAKLQFFEKKKKKKSPKTTKMFNSICQKLAQLPATWKGA